MVWNHGRFDPNLKRYTYKTSSYITSSYKTSSYKTSGTKHPVTERPGYKTSIYQTSSYRTSIVFFIDLSSLLQFVAIMKVLQFFISRKNVPRLWHIIISNFLNCPMKRTLKNSWKLSHHSFFPPPRTYRTVVLSWIIHHRELLIEANLKNICI